MDELQQKQTLARLCNALEEAAGRKMYTPKDFEYLSMCISRQMHQTVSVSTLKRLWGYYTAEVTPRRFTLDLLSQYLGYRDWNHFCQPDAEPASRPAGPAELPADDSPAAAGGRRRGYVRPLLLVLLAAMAAAAVYGYSRFSALPDAPADVSEEHYVLHKGDTFASYEEYLRLFGIVLEDTTEWFSQLLPHHEGIEIWGPQYMHPEWHNEGNADSLMPTITEYWSPQNESDDPVVREYVGRLNSAHHFMALRTNLLRITFMRGLCDSTFTFLGVYRMSSKSLSDTTCVVWERVSDECDLRALDYLQLLRR